jgi:hypothetical protein
MVDYIPSRGVNAAGTEQFNPGTQTPTRVKKVWFDYVATQIYVGSVVAHNFAADPRDGFTVGPGHEVVVLPAVTGVGKARIAGVVVDLGETGGVADGWILIATLVPGEVYTFAVAVGIDSGDGLKLANSGAYADDSGTYAVTDAAIALYDEDDANNPHGTSAISVAIGLVEAVWTGADLADTA